MLTEQQVRWGFVGAGLSNIIGILVFTRFYTDSYFFTVFPQVMSEFGVTIIMVWGLVWIAMSAQYRHVRALVGIFVVEKSCYVLSWVAWLGFSQSPPLSQIFENSVMAGLFFVCYGAHDFLWGCFFAWVFFKGIPAGTAGRRPA